ncbi:MAG: silent information regulator protein Sir2 [Candidatus Brocadiia bacterium]
MRKFVALGAVLAASGWAWAGELHVPNDSFEKAAGDGALGWHWWSRTGSGAATRTSDVHHSLGHSMAIRHDAERDWAFSSDHRFPVTPGQVYRASAWARVARGHVELAAVALREGKTLSWNIGSRSTGPTEGWVKLQAVVDVPRGCGHIYLRFVGEGDTLAWVDDVGLEPWERPQAAEMPRVRGYADQRVQEKLDRGLLAMPVADGKVYLGWRLLLDDPPDVAFDLYRRRGKAPAEKLNPKPIVKTTDFVDSTAAKGVAHTYYVVARRGEEALGPSEEVEAKPTDEPKPYLAVKLDGDDTFQKAGVADLDGDGGYDFVIKQPNANIDPWHKYWKPSPDTYKLEAYRHDGRLLWRHDLGWAIERGIWYSPYVVYDLDGDGRAEVAVKTGEGDPRDEEGKVRSGPEYLSVLDGRTGAPRARTPWPSREPFMQRRHGYNYASRNQLGIAYLDGKTPCLIVERGTYNIIIVVAYQFHRGELRELWRWDNRTEPRRYWGQGAHWMHAADVDEDGRDEVIIGSAVIDDNGTGLWSTGLGHPDHSYVGDIDPDRPGLEIYYGIESRQRVANGMCLVDARTGEILWGHQGFTRHVHSRGMCSDIDPRYPGAECYSADTDERKKLAWARLRTAKGKVISEDASWGFGPLVAYWDADPQREVLHRGRIESYRGERLPTRVEGHVAAIADILGDWREEIVTSVRGELRIYTTTIPADHRYPCLMRDPLYRLDVAHAAMGYFQAPMLGIDLASRLR